MKVVHISETIKGGVGTCMNVFDNAFVGEFESIYVVPAQHADHLSVTGEVVTFDRPKRGLKAIGNLVSVAHRIVRREKPEILFFQSSYSLFVMAAFRAMRVPGRYVYTPHGWSRLRYDHRPGLQKVVGFVEGRISRLADVVVNVSRHDLEMARQSGYGGNHVVVENAMPDLDVPPTRGRFEIDKTNLLFVGRFDRQKGLDILLKAFAEACGRFPDLHLHIIGAAVEDGDEGHGGEIPDRITYHGWVHASDIQSYYASADLVVMPSRWESLPMVIIESLRVGTPVMLSNVCGMSRLIDDGESGFAVALDEPSWAAAFEVLSKANLAEMRDPSRALYKNRYGLERYRVEMRELMNALMDG